MTIRHDRIAINPLQWIATEDGWIDPALAPALPERLKAIHAAGIAAVHADVPAQMSAAEYGRLLGEHGLAPAPGYISGPLPRTRAACANCSTRPTASAPRWPNWACPSSSWPPG
ncbi:MULTISPECIES: hypothetical protein [Streptomyces]|uniref:hypothetical protein n=1 Tax=Streptomyces TaxID=1883 RepID=UPI000B0F7CCF|nr:hypothetical protein [Streptomyces melanosporofaciens]